MPAPVTSVLDDFNRSDEDPVSQSGAWSNGIYPDTSGTGHKVVSNQLQRKDASLTNGSWRNGSTFIDCEAFVTVPTVPTVTFGLILRMTNPATSSMKAYIAGWFPNQYYIGILDYTAYSYGLPGSPLLYGDTGVLGSGHKLSFRALGDLLTLAHYDGSSWTDVCEINDSTITGAGYIGVGSSTYSNAYILDDFGGGQLSTVYTDSATIICKTTPSIIEIGPGLDASLIKSVTAFSAVEFAGRIDAATIKSITRITTGEIEYLVPAGSWGPFDTDNGTL